MGRAAKNQVVLTEEQRKELEAITRKRTEQAQRVTRARILLMSSEGESNVNIAAALNVNRNTVTLCQRKFCESGMESALKDDEGRGRKPVITDEDNMYVINLACQSPYTLGYAQEMWTLETLRKYVQANCVEAGCPNLANVSKSKICSILKEGEIKPHKIRYYLERRDRDFDAKMEDVLLVYRQLEFEAVTGSEPQDVTLSYDEKPGVQCISNTAPDLRPGNGYGYISRDHEYERHGTLSLLAAIDLRSGEVIPLVRETHKSADFIEFLKLLDDKYDKNLIIRIILDNHSAHISKETRKYLAEHPGRFDFIFTPTHGSWLNLIESFFGKMAKVFFRGIRVDSTDEMKTRIYKYFDEVNAEPVPYRWKFRMNLMDAKELDLEKVKELNLDDAKELNLQNVKELTFG